MDIVVYQGEGPKTKDCQKLGKFEICDIAPAPVGTPDINIKFAIDESGILKVTAYDDTDESNIKDLKVNINKGRFSAEEI